MKHKMAIYKSIRMGYESPSRIEFYENDKSYIRMSEPVEVDFPMLPAAETVKHQLSALVTLEEAVRKEYAEKLAAIANERAKLQALTYAPSEAA